MFFVILVLFQLFKNKNLARGYCRTPETHSNEKNQCCGYAKWLPHEIYFPNMIIFQMS